MTNKFILALILLAIGGCKDGKSSDEGYSTCLGFGAPIVNIRVQNTLDGTTIEHAKVKVNILGSTTSEVFEAVYVSGEDNNADTDAGAYYAIASINESSYKINVVTAADGFKGAQSKNFDFKINTACGADNTFRHTVKLCPEGVVCE